MKDMINFPIRGLPQNYYKRLQLLAAKRNLSVNKMTVLLIEAALDTLEEVSDD